MPWHRAVVALHLTSGLAIKKLMTLLYVSYVYFSAERKLLSLLVLFISKFYLLYWF